MPLFSMFRALGLINSLPGLALFNVVASVSFATVILSGLFPDDPAGPHRRRSLRRRRPYRCPAPDRGPVGSARDRRRRRPRGDLRVERLRRGPGAHPAARPFTAQLALTRFSTFYATDQGLTFAGMAIAIVPPLLLFLVLQRSFIQGLTSAAGRG